MALFESCSLVILYMLWIKDITNLNFEEAYSWLDIRVLIILLCPCCYHILILICV